MKLVFAAILLVSVGAVAENDLEMTSLEYQRALKGSVFNVLKGEDRELQVILDTGKRNLDWLIYINQHRSNAKLSFSSKETQIGIPMDHPRLYNPTLITQTFNALVGQLPQGMSDVLINEKAFLENPPLPEKEYLDWGRKVDLSYQMASRWLLMKPYLNQYAERKRTDIRGYYYLSLDRDVKTKLQNWNSLDPDTTKNFHFYLLTMCLNDDRDENLCVRDLDNAIKDNVVLSFYNQYFQAAEAMYQSFFKIVYSRNDASWKESSNEFDVPFLDPLNSDVKDFLVDNIQDEWKWNNWHLALNFVNSGNVTNVVFDPGATPHVNELAGNNITMDANQPLSEYDTQWTIRHEYGHTLGFPDCYVEYYDSSQQVMVGYQLDITNLMCSRRGHLQERHYNELRRVYGSVNQFK